MNLSFAGCGFLGIYHIGVACCFRKYCPQLLLNKISGASIGAVSACCLLCDLPLGEMTSDTLRVAAQARSRSLGPFHPSFNIQTLLLEGLEKILPEDAHLKVSGKLHISLTRVRDGKNVIVSHFESRKDLLQALLASAFIPFFSGFVPPKYHGVRYMDGGFSDNLPSLDENTITVSPFCGESDICPRDDSSQLFHINVANTSIELSKYNIYRIGRILYPPKPEILSNMCRQGFDDALRFLHMNNLINCTRCLAVQSTFVVMDNTTDDLDYDPECHECNKHRQEALVSSMPETVVTIFQEAIDKANKGLVNWVFKHRGMKLLSILTLPYTLPVDIMYCTFVKLVSSTPQLTGIVWDVSKYFMDQVAEMINKANKKRKQLSSKITCQLKITEYTGESYDDEDNQEPHITTRNKVNLNFTLDMDDSELPVEKNLQRRFSSSKLLSKKPNLTTPAVSERKEEDVLDHDAFEHILQVTSDHEAIMAYYYMDENNKVKVTEIFDVTDCESEVVQTAQEKERNAQLEFDDGFEQSSWSKETNAYRLSCERSSSECSLEDFLDKEASNIFSDPESEWTGASYKVEEPEDEIQHLKPECEQPKYKIPSLTYEQLDS